MNNYREQFFEWVNKQPVYQDMTLQTKEMTLNLVNCWLNNNQAYFHYARLNGKDFARRCAIDFCWFIKNQTIVDLQHRLDVVEKALGLLIDIYYDKSRPDLELKLHSFAFKKGIVEFIKGQAESELKGE